MERLLWIGPRRGPPELKGLLASQGVELLTFEDADAALAATAGLPVAAAVITSSGRELPQIVEGLMRSRPETQVLLATDVGIPRSLVLALWAGAVSVLDFQSQRRDEILRDIQESVARHRRIAKERELLLRLRGLNEDFLKNVVAIEKRNIELEERLKPEADQVAEPEDGKERVLIVDDESVVCDVLGVVLRKSSYPFEAVASAEEALRVLPRRHFHLIITDKNLPGMSGIDLLSEAKKVSPETDVMMMTGYASMESAITALDRGAVAYLEKPFDHVNAVQKKIEDVLERQRERNRKRRYLYVIKQRNHAFLEQYKAIRADLESWLQSRGEEGNGTEAETSVTRRSVRPTERGSA